MSSDPFDLGAVSQDDIKNAFGHLVQILDSLPFRKDLWTEKTEDCKYDLLALCQRNSELFRVTRK